MPMHADSRVENRESKQFVLVGTDLPENLVRRTDENVKKVLKKRNENPDLSQLK